MHHCRKIAIAGLAICLFAMGTHSIPLSLPTIVSAQAPVITIIPQPDAPIRISLGRVVSDNPYEPEFEYSLLNVSEKSIRAHSIRIDDQLLGSTLSIHKFPWQSGHTMPGTYGGNMKSSTPIKGVRMSVDFVEFVDGTRWGPDTTNAAERVAGHYAGRRAERDLLLKLLREGGTPTVISALEPDEAQLVSPPPGFSERWEHNYRVGMNAFRLELRRIYRSEGAAAMEISLRKEIDRK